MGDFRYIYVKYFLLIYMPIRIYMPILIYIYICACTRMYTYTHLYSVYINFKKMRYREEVRRIEHIYILLIIYIYY